MPEFNKLTLLLINLICLLVHSGAQAETNRQRLIQSSSTFESRLVATVDDEEPKLNRVKRKGIGSFFGVKSKTTPNTWENNWNAQQNGRLPIHGYSGEIHGSGTNYFQEHENRSESSIYYLIVGSISLGIIVYCCYQFRSDSRGDLNNRLAYRTSQHTRSLNDSSPDEQFGNNDSNSKPSTSLAPSAPTLIPIDDVAGDRSLSTFTDFPEHPPPSYQEAVANDRKSFVI